MGLIIPQNRSKLGIWERNTQISIADAASLRFATDDLLIFFWIRNILKASTYDSTFKKAGGGPLLGVSRIGDARFRLWMTDDLANAVDRDFYPTNSDSTIIHIWINRTTGYAAIYENADTLLLNGDFTAVTGNIDPTGNLVLHGDNFPNASMLLSFAIYNFGSGGIPSADDQGIIMSQHKVNPYDVPVALSTRGSYATEEKIRINFNNCDPASTTIADKSAYSNDGALSAGTVATAVKEFYGV